MGDRESEGAVRDQKGGLGPTEEGRALLVEGKLLEARASFERAVQADATEPHALLFQVWSELALERNAKQKVAVQVKLALMIGKALEGRPDCAVAHYLGAELALLRRHFDEAERHFRRAKSRNLSQLHCQCHLQRTAPIGEPASVRRVAVRSPDRGLSKMTPGGFDLASLDLKAPLDPRTAVLAPHLQDAFAAAQVTIRQPPRRITSLIREAVTPGAVEQPVVIGSDASPLLAAERPAHAEADSVGGLTRATPISSSEMDALCELLAAEEAPASVRGGEAVTTVSPANARDTASQAAAPEPQPLEETVAPPQSPVTAPIPSKLRALPPRKRIVRLLAGLAASLVLLMGAMVVPRLAGPTVLDPNFVGSARAAATARPAAPSQKVVPPASVSAAVLPETPANQRTPATLETTATEKTAVIQETVATAKTAVITGTAAKVETRPAEPTKPAESTKPAASVPPAATKMSRLVVSKIRGRRVFVDGRLIGESPLSVEIACGRHDVRIGSKGTDNSLEFPCGETVER